MTHARSVARFKQLCCLGLPGQIAMPALLGALHDVVPSYANIFFWSDAQGRVDNALFENLDEVQPLLPLYFSEYADKREREVVSSHAETFRSRRGVWSLEEDLRVDRRTYHRHDFYQEFMRPSGYHDGLLALVCDGTRPLGLVAIGRKPGEAEFRSRDKLRLAALLAYLGHALAAPADAPVRFTDGDDEGLLIVDERGRIRHQSAEARRLVFLVTHPIVVNCSASHSAGRDLLHAGLSRLVRRLKSSTGDAPNGVRDGPPVWRHHNAWGEFVFRAYWMDDAGTASAEAGAGVSPERSRLIGISVRHREPLVLGLLRRMDGMVLSPRQREIGLLLAQGASFAEVARRLGVSERTAQAHTRALYDKLDVHNRAELVNRLLS